MIAVYLIGGALVGFVIGILFEKSNKNKVSAAIAEIKMVEDKIGSVVKKL